ncbi:MAG: response regulator [Deltaproteobacteria bacterium]|jgi:signal transduction histidine kinase/CheY-like chemotaxis protein|nr:response regulator [Deltaproteobacteria bacterium]
MSFLWKVFLISVGILVFIIGITVGTSLYFIHRGITETILSDLSVMAKIAERLISSEINLIKARAWTAVHHLENVPQAKWPAILQAQLEANPEFLAITVFNVDGRVEAVAGSPLTPPDLVGSQYIQKAKEGLTVISTTRSLPTGELVFHICVPLDKERVASVTAPGLYFSRILARYRIWNSGSVYILDEDGKVLANERTHLVLGEYNGAQDYTDDINVNSLREYTKTMIQGGRGTGRYVLEDQERLGYFTSIEGSNVGWTLGVSAPLSESPLNYVDQAVILMTMIFLAVGVLIAWLTAGFVDRQFNIINEQYKNLAKLSEIASGASEAKTNFLANMSHEMRTPLNAIIGFSELMIYGRSGDEERRESLEKIHLAGLTLLGIVNDILDISKIESGRFELIEDEYDLSSVINDTVTVNLIRIGEKPIEFGLEIDKSIPSRLVGDELRIKQICANILSNAFKYTLEGHVNMLVTAKVEGETVWLSIRVQDTGIGIKPEDLSKLFSAYNQVDPKSNSKIEGAGLGLSITKKMVDMMGGRIEVESEYGQGSTFTVIVRQRVATATPLGQRTVESLESVKFYKSRHSGSDRDIVPMPHAKILLVDDVQANLDVAKGILKPYQMRIDCVTSGQMAVDLIREENVIYDAVFMDHMMPGMDGLETVRVIREEIDTDYARTVPIIALTANAIMGNDKIFLENGFQAFLTKPIEIYRMDVVLRQWVRDSAREIAASPTDSGAGESLVESVDSIRKLAIAGLDLEEARRRFGGDEETLTNVLRSYADNMPELLDKLKTPNKENLKDYTITVHGIKSSSYGVGALEVGDQAKELEERSEAGDFDFVQAHNWRFIRLVEKVVADLKSQLAPQAVTAERQKIAGPDPAALIQLREACQNYDMDGLDAALASLSRFDYEADPELLPWLRDKVERMALNEILEAIDATGALKVHIAPTSGEPEQKPKTALKEPDWALLAHLAKAAGDFDMDKVDTAMEELTAHTYEKNNDLVEWLREKVNAMEFIEVRERLESLASSVTQAGHGEKPRKGAPDPVVLERLRQACLSYDMDGVDGAIADLEGFSYQEGEDLALWLKDKVVMMEFGEIVKRLSGQARET